MNDATLQKILEVKDHPNADRLDLVKILGYQLVVAKNQFEAGETVVFIQPDSVLPENADWAAPYRKYAPGRIRAVRLRNEWSEGIAVPIKDVEELLDPTRTIPRNKYVCTYIPKIGEDVSELLGVTHYEPPAPQDLSAKGRLPFGIPKTDETRIESFTEDDLEQVLGEHCDVTVKVDGQSWTAYYNLETDEFGVCGRTLEMKLDCFNKYTAQIDRYDIQNKLTEYCKKYRVSLAIRGESYGPGIQAFAANPHAKMDAGLAIFSVYNIKEQRYERRGSFHYFRNVCSEMGIPTVPILESGSTISRQMIEDYSLNIKHIDGKPFEGVVIQFSGGSFKIISKHYDSRK